MLKEYNHLKKKLKLTKYFKDKIWSTGVLFLQESYSNNKFQQKCEDEFKGHVFFSQGKET